MRHASSPPEAPTVGTAESDNPRLERQLDLRDAGHQLNYIGRLRRRLADCLTQLKHDSRSEPFYASSESAEPRCPGLSAEVLVHIEPEEELLGGSHPGELMGEEVREAPPPSHVP